MTEHNSPPEFDHLDGSQCLEHLNNLLRDLDAFGIPPGMHRVGTLNLGENQPPALLPGLGEGHTQLADNSYESLELARLLVKQMLDGADPGTVKLTVLDSELTNAFADFAALGSGLFNQINPNQLSGFIEDLKQKITDAANSGRSFGTLANPRQILVLAGDHGLKPEQIAELNRIIASSMGAEWGSIVALGAELEPHDLLFDGFPEGIEITPDPALETPSVVFDCRMLSEKAQLGGASPELEDIIPEEMWTKSAQDGLTGYMGKTDEGEVLGVTFDDESPHWLFTGTSGSGKTVAIKAMLTSLAHEYSPREFRYLVLDFKEGVEFGSFAASARDPSYHPHAKLVGSNVNNDPEFGIGVLQYLSNEIQRRADLCKEYGEPNYAQLRKADPNLELPRIVALLDEFQVLLSGPQAAEAIVLLEDLARRGRSFGIHLAMSSQNVDGIQALWAKGSSLWGNFKGRASLPHGTLMRSDNNAPSELPTHHIVVNNNSGHPNNNKIFKVAHAHPDAVSEHQQKVWQNRPDTSVEPTVFDAKTVPKLEEARVFKRLKPSTLRPPKMILADEISVEGGSASIELTQQSGKNVAIVGRRIEEVNRVMHTAAVSIGQQRNPGDASFSLLCLDPKSANAVETTAETLRAKGHTVDIITPQKAQAFLAQTSESIKPGDNQQKFVFVYGAGANDEAMAKPVVSKTTHPIEDNMELSINSYGETKFSKGETIASIKDGSGKPIVAASNNVTVKKEGKELVITETSPAGYDGLRDIMKRGPEQGVHVVVSTESGERLTNLVTTGHSPNTGVIGGYVAVGVSPDEMSRFNRDEQLISTSNAQGAGRPNRAKFYDSTARKKSRTVIPYAGPKGLSSSPDDDEEED